MCEEDWVDVLNSNLLLSDPLPNIKIDTIGSVTPSSLNAHVVKTILHRKNGTVRCKTHTKIN